MGTLRTGATVQTGNRPSSYYAASRPEVAALVPPSCRRILEVGCGAGGLGRLLQERGHRVTGLELVPEVADQARVYLNHVVTADVETDGFPFAPHSFDAILFADVLEHLIDPWRVLREATSVLVSRGLVIASIPNLQNGDVLWRLLRGRWEYRERGLTDFGHLRFFTLQTIRGLFEQAGLELIQVERHYRQTWLREFLALVTCGTARAFFTRQYLVVGRKKEVSREESGESKRIPGKRGEKEPNAIFHHFP
jgi:SAM-dependent methyltransferase